MILRMFINMSERDRYKISLLCSLTEKKKKEKKEAVLNN